MNKNQYKRLSLVMIIPLAISGWCLSQYVPAADPQGVYCLYSKASRKFNCSQDIGRLYSKRYMNVIGSNYPGIDRLFFGGAIVFGPFAVEVFNTKRMPIKADNFKGVVGDSNGRLSDDDYSKVAKGEFDLSDIEYINNLPERNGNKVIYIDGEKTSRISVGGEGVGYVCKMDEFVEEFWAMSCINGGRHRPEAGGFPVEVVVLDKDVNKILKMVSEDARRMMRELNEKSKSIRRFLLSVSYLAPFVMYFALSLVIYLIALIVRFVVKGLD